MMMAIIRAMAMRMRVSLDAKSLAAAKAMRRHLPTKDIRAGLAHIIRREMSRVRTLTIKEAGARTGLKARFLKRISGITATAFRGVFWFVARNFKLHGLGAVKQSKRGAPIIASGRTLRRNKRASHRRAFIIGKRVLVRDSGSRRLRPYFADTEMPLRRAFYIGVKNAGRGLSGRVINELDRRLAKWRARINRAR